MAPRDPQLTRRGFVAAATATGITAGLSSCAPKHSKPSPGPESQGPADPYANATIFYSTCPPECQHHNLKGYVVDGKLVKVESSELNDCAACGRGIARAFMHRDPDRLLYPLVRDGEKGSGKFRRISWDEAVDLIAQKLRWAIARGGNESICYVTGSGNFGNLHNAAAAPFFAGLGGASTTTGVLCCAAAYSATIPMFGRRFMDCRNQIANSTYLIVWGNNPAVSMQGYFGRLMEMREKGGTLVVIDPLVTETASKADLHLRPLPGTDAALGLAMLHVIIHEDLMDRDFLVAHSDACALIDRATGTPVPVNPDVASSFAAWDTLANQMASLGAPGIAAALTTEGTPLAHTHCTVFDLIREQADLWTPEAAAQECGVDPDLIVTVARNYARAQGAMIIQNMGGFMRTYNGAYAVGIANYLALFTGQIGGVGNGISDAGGINVLFAGKPFPHAPAMPDFQPIPRFNFGDHVLSEDIHPVNFLWSMTGNPMTQWPNTNKVRAALQKIPYVVSVDQYLTDTCLYSDLVLPCAGIFEYEGVLCSSRSHYVQIYEKAVEPAGEAKTDLEIFQAVAKHMGFGQNYLFDSLDTLMDRVLEPTGITLERLRREKAIDVVGTDYIAYEGGVFYTSTGRAHLWVAEWKEEGFSPVCSYERAQEDLRNPQLAARYPLMAVQRKTYRSVHSTFNNLEWMDEMWESRPTILINTEDAAARGIASGDAVVAFNDRGEHRGIAEVGERTIPGVVGLQNGWWGDTSSQVTNDLWGSLGHTHCCNQTLIDVRKED